MPILADEHVDRAYITGLRESGFAVKAVTTACSGALDSELLDYSRAESLVKLTNDDDFVRLATNQSHSGVIFYSDRSHQPREFIAAIRRIDRYLSMNEFADHIEWLENWM